MRTLKITLPKTWNELTDRQLAAMAMLFHSGRNGKLFDLSVLFILMDVRWWQFRKKHKAVQLLRQVPLSELKEHYAFVYKEHNRTAFPMLPSYNGTKRFPPMDRIANLTAEEFAVAEDLHVLWLKNKSRTALEYLAAVLYSPFLSERLSFDKMQLDLRSKIYTELPLKQLLAIELAYSGCKNHIVAKFPRAFPKGSAPAGGNKYGFGKVILQMAGGKFGTHRETRQTNIYTFLEEFEENLKPKKP